MALCKHVNNAPDRLLAFIVPTRAESSYFPITGPVQVALLDYYFYCILQMDTMLCVVSKSAVISAMVVGVVLVLAWWQSGWCLQKSLVFYLVKDLRWGASKLMISAILIVRCRDL
ncbi:hypothetical protein ES332_A10G248200v1 [Gossypium tomentosum]|uniref:Uncharacterized protein n=1 Tax=Gossypium tomentosum TaxID=34277 RepID=A0A5D2NUI1_GOSTO|nr:hypothetical protein ES332_A10G248200v1 [Gossypium tomentosum]